MDSFFWGLTVGALLELAGERLWRWHTGGHRRHLERLQRAELEELRELRDLLQRRTAAIRQQKAREAFAALGHEVDAGRVEDAVLE